jgi:2',3'-cyclic-nucleotide 2'-phosphodiesterase (5'-nucleotidase family)
MITAVLAATLALGAQDTVHARVLTTHDFHGTLQPRVYDWSDGRPVGGIGVVKTVMDRAEAECACPTFRFDGGDQMQGSLSSNLTYGATVVTAFNILGIDAAAVGNHELDWGVDTLLARQREASYPWLAANVFERDTGRRPPWAPPYVILEIDGVRVGVIGYLTSTTSSMLVSEMAAPFEFRRGASAVGSALSTVRAVRPDFTVIVAHAGGGCRDDRCGGEMVELARALDSGSVDLIVSGHDHRSGFAVVNGIPILRGGAGGRAIGVVDLYRLPDGRRWSRVAVDTVFADATRPDSGVLRAIAPFLAHADSVAQRQVATLRDPLDRRGDEYGLGRLIADAARRAASSDLAFTNRGGIRRELPAGPVTYGELFEVLPFGNAVYRLDVTGSQLMEILSHAADRPSHIFSGIRIAYDPTRPAGERLVSAELADGRPIVDDGRYAVGLPDFLARGGGGWGMLEGLRARAMGVTMLDALIEHLRSLPQPVVAPDDWRMTAVDQ